MELQYLLFTDHFKLHNICSTNLNIKSFINCQTIIDKYVHNIDRFYIYLNIIYINNMGFRVANIYTYITLETYEI